MSAAAVPPQPASAESLPDDPKTTDVRVVIREEADSSNSDSDEDDPDFGADFPDVRGTMVARTEADLQRFAASTPKLLEIIRYTVGDFCILLSLSFYKLFVSFMTE